MPKMGGLRACRGYFFYCKVKWFWRPQIHKGPEKVVKYLSLYTNRAAISNYRLTKIQDDRVYFLDKQYVDKGKKVVFKETSLGALVFITRFLIHILPKNFHRIRYYGLFANGQCKKNVQLIWEILASTGEPSQKKADNEDMLWQPPCPKCKSGRMVTAYTVHPRGAMVVNLAAYRRLNHNGGFDSS